MKHNMNYQHTIVNDRKLIINAMKTPIDTATAKEEIERINEVLTTPHLLIGGLAVQQYHIPRDSSDIDLVCEFNIAKMILKKLYPSLDWNVDEPRRDEYRPTYKITHKYDEEQGTIYFGPKITEREPYNFIEWNELKKGAKQFVSKDGKKLNNILVPTPHALAYTKFISFLCRTENQDKIENDLRDFCDLTNLSNFSASDFFNLLRRSKAPNELITNFNEKSNSYSEIAEGSCLFNLSKMFINNSIHSIDYLNPANKSNLVSEKTVYLAAPHKNIPKNNKLSHALKQHGFDVRLPYELVSKNRLNTDTDHADSIRNICITAIESSKFLVVDLDTYGLDTAWELGYAEGLGKKIVGFNEDIFLTTDERHITRRQYNHNFMHGWSQQTIFPDLESAESICRDKIVYVCGSFANAEISKVAKSTLRKFTKTLIIPKEHVENQRQLPKDYPLMERTETNKLLENSDIVLVILPRYGMDSSWQIGYATAKKKTIYGLMLTDDRKEFVSQSFWDHWMHGWKSKLRTTGINELCAVLVGLAEIISDQS